MEFVKMHGNGNDFIVIDDREEKYLDKEADLAKELCHRHFAIGADGILIVRNSKNCDTQMLIYNADGSYASMCGNGIRCFVKYVWDQKLIKKNPLTIETGDGIKRALLTIEDEKAIEITINMGKPSFDPKDFQGDFTEEVVEKLIQVNGQQYKITSMLMGVPHTIILGALDSFNVESGKFIEACSLFKKGTNVNFVEVINKNHIKVKTWERGAGETLACGTGCCASVVAVNKLGLTCSEVVVEVPGGEMKVEIKAEGVMMTGPAKTLFRGEYFK